MTTACTGVLAVALVSAGTGQTADLTRGRADFTYVSGAEPETLDPARMTGAIEHRIATAILEGLTTYDPKDLSPRPGMAKAWTISDDRLTYTFHLREGATWTNGQPVTARDFEWSWRRVLDPATASEYVYQLYYIKGAAAFYKRAAARLKDKTLPAPDPGTVGIRAVDDRTLVVTLENPTPYFLNLTAFMTYLPVNRTCVEQHKTAWTRPGHIVTNGPYRLIEWKFYRRIRLAKNPAYWNAANVRSNTVDILPTEEVSAAYAAYEQRRADFITTVPLKLVPKLLARKRKDFHVSPFLATYFYRFNCTRKPFDDVRVRRAFAMAIDKARIVKFVTRGGQKATNAFVPAGLPGYTPPKGLAYNPAEAKRLLRQAYPDVGTFPTVKLLYNTSESHKDIAEVVQAQLKRNLGVKVNLVNQEWKVYLHTVNEKDYDWARGGWIGDYLDPNTFLDMFVTGGGNNRTGWSNTTYDRLIADARRQRDPVKRLALLRRAEEILVNEELPIVPIYTYVVQNMYRENVHGIWPNLLNLHPLQYIRVGR